MNEYLIQVAPDKISSDPDNTLISRLFYRKWWGKILTEDLTKYAEGIGNYRGETIISFNTIAGATIRLLKCYNQKNFSMPDSHYGRLKVILYSDDITEEMKVKFVKFYDLSHTLANFMPLYVSKPSLNGVKGKGPYHDFPDLFYSDVRDKRYGSSTNADKFIVNNKDYFSKFKDWKSFIELNYLQDFFDDEDYMTFKKLAPSSSFFPYQRKSLTPDEKSKCLEEVNTFLNNAIEIILSRGSRFYI